MGIFDYVKVHEKHGLPNYTYQTKDIDSQFDVLEITEDGRLIITGHSPVDLNHHGPLNFYAIADEDEWLEYDATFDNGTLASFKRRWPPE